MMAMKPSSKFNSMDASGMDKVYRPERDGAKIPAKGSGTPPRNPMDKVYRPERDGAKVPAKGPGIPPRNPFANKPSSMMQQDSAESIKKQAMIADAARSQKNARINAMKKMVGG